MIFILFIYITNQKIKDFLIRNFVEKSYTLSVYSGNGIFLILMCQSIKQKVPNNKKNSMNHIYTSNFLLKCAIVPVLSDGDCSIELLGEPMSTLLYINLVIT